MKKIKLTANIKYTVIDETLYLFLLNDKILDDEVNLAKKKINILVEDNELSYINISGKHLEDYKEKINDLGYNMSYYDINKLNYLYPKAKDKKAYRCYGLITKKDYYENYNKIKSKIIPKKENICANYGYINNILILSIGIIMLCIFSVLGSIELIK